jgi:hypothetical protein
MTSHPIRIEQYDSYLYEISDLTPVRLKELDNHLTMSVVPLSSDFREFHRTLKKLLSSLDVPRAS